MTTTATTYTLTVPGRLLTVNGTRGKHWSAYGPATKLWRFDTKIMAKDAKIPHCDKVRIIATPLQCKGRLADPGGHAVVVKAAIDGLVDSGVIDDDDGEHVEGVYQTAPIRVSARDEGLRLVIQPITDEGGSVTLRPSPFPDWVPEVYK